MSHRASRERTRAAAIAALWLVHAALPFLISLHRVDPLACCRGDGAHRCFMRAKAATGGMTFGLETKTCPTAKTKAVSFHPVAIAVSSRFAEPFQQSRISYVPATRPLLAVAGSRTSRAPPED